MIIFPIPLQVSALALARPALALAIDLPTFEGDLWIALVTDAKHESEADPIVGYLRLERRLTQQPGLTTYAVVEARPAGDPPPNPASLTTIFRSPSLADYERLWQGRSVRHG